LTQLLESCGFFVVGRHRLPVFSMPSLAQSLNRYQVMWPLVWLLQRLPWRGLIRLLLSGEICFVVRKIGEVPDDQASSRSCVTNPQILSRPHAVRCADDGIARRCPFRHCGAWLSPVGRLQVLLRVTFVRTPLVLESLA